jgi:hypothetical protein
VKRGQSLEYEQQAPHELKAPIRRDAWEICGTILFTDNPSLLERSRWTEERLETAFAVACYWVEQGTFHTSVCSQQ